MGGEGRASGVWRLQHEEGKWPDAHPRWNVDCESTAEAEASEEAAAAVRGADVVGEWLRVGGGGSWPGRARCHSCLSNQVDEMLISEAGRSFWGERELSFDVSRLRRHLLDRHPGAEDGREAAGWESGLESDALGMSVHRRGAKPVTVQSPREQEWTGQKKAKASAQGPLQQVGRTPAGKPSEQEPKAMRLEEEGDEPSPQWGP